MLLQATYPTPEHQIAADAIVDFFVSNYKIDAVLLVNSCARGKATRDSCLDIIMLAKPDESRSQLSALEAGWTEFEKSNQAIKALYKVGKYSVVHPDFIHGIFIPQEQDEADGPDDFEVQIGNFLAYSVPLWQGSDYFTQLKGQWLPYYSEELRQQDWIEYDGTASTTYITFHFTLNGNCIFNLLTGFTTHTVSFCKPCSSRAERIRLPTINGFGNRWRF